MPADAVSPKNAGIATCVGTSGDNRLDVKARKAADRCPESEVQHRLLRERVKPPSDVQIGAPIAPLVLLEFTIVRYSTTPIALVISRMNLWFSDGIPAFDKASVRDSDEICSPVVTTRG